MSVCFADKRHKATADRHILVKLAEVIGVRRTVQWIRNMFNERFDPYYLGSPFFAKDGALRADCKTFAFCLDEEIAWRVIKKRRTLLKRWFELENGCGRSTVSLPLSSSSRTAAIFCSASLFNIVQPTLSVHDLSVLRMLIWVEMVESRSKMECWLLWTKTLER